MKAKYLLGFYRVVYEYWYMIQIMNLMLFQIHVWSVNRECNMNSNFYNFFQEDDLIFKKCFIWCSRMIMNLNLTLSDYNSIDYENCTSLSLLIIVIYNIYFFFFFSLYFKIIYIYCFYLFIIQVFFYFFILQFYLLFNLSLINFPFFFIFFLVFTVLFIVLS